MGRARRRVLICPATARCTGEESRWRPGSRRCTFHELENAGNTLAEIYARCGEPDHRYDLSPPGPYSYAGPYASGERRERWTYDFGPRQHARELEFVNGRLQRIDTLRR